MILLHPNLHVTGILFAVSHPSYTYIFIHTCSSISYSSSLLSYCLILYSTCSSFLYSHVTTSLYVSLLVHSFFFYTCMFDVCTSFSRVLYYVTPCSLLYTCFIHLCLSLSLMYFVSLSFISLHPIHLYSSRLLLFYVSTYGVSHHTLRSCSTYYLTLFITYCSFFTRYIHSHLTVSYVLRHVP